MLQSLRRQGSLPRAQPVPIGATHGIESTVLAAMHGTNDKLARIGDAIGTRTQEPTADGVNHPQREHVDVTPPHAGGATEQMSHSRTRHCRRSPARTVVTSSGTTASAFESASADRSNEAGVPMTAAL